MGAVKGSSHVKKIGFAGAAGETSTLRIQFDDTTLDFLKVPYRIFRGLATAKDVSSYYFSHVYGKFKYEEV